MFEWLFKYPLDAYRTGELGYAFAGSLSWLVAAFVIAAAILGALLVRRNSLPPGRRLAVLVLQLAVTAGALWLVAQPELIDEQPVAGSNAIALVLDDSASMAVADNNAPRLATATAWLDAVAAELGETYVIERLTLSDIATDRADYVDVTATHAESPLAGALAGLAERRRTDPLAAIVVASDGLATGTEQEAALDALSAAAIPVFARRTGRDVIPEDLALTAVTVPGEVVPGARFDAVLTIRHDSAGVAGLRVLANDDTLLAKQDIELPASRLTTEVRVPLTLADGGFHTLSFELTRAGGEPFTANNKAYRVVAAPDRQFRVLYFEGEPRWEYKFLRRALTDDDIRLTSLLRVSPNKFYRQGLADPAELEAGFPTAAGELFAYDAVILGSVEAAALSAAQQTLLRDFVSVRGGSLMLIAGPNGLGNGGWGESALSLALPAQLPAFGTDTFVRDHAVVTPTLYGRAVATLTLADDSARGWDDLPAVADYQTLGPLRPAAETWLTVRTANGQEPLLVTQPYGRGRSYLFGTGGTWRWQMQLPVEDERHERFWRQLIRTMVAAAPQRETTRVVADGEQLAIEAEFFDDTWQPRTALSVSASLDGEQENSSATVDLAPVADRPGAYRATIERPDVGVHYIETTARQGGAVTGFARTALAGASVRPELRRIRASDAALAAIARASGGALLTDPTPAALASALLRDSAGITELTRRPIWDAPFMLLALLALKSLEWLVRRRWGQI